MAGKITEIRSVLSFFKGILQKEGIRVKKIILFGSSVMGKRKHGSDLDLIVISPSFTGKNLFERARIIGRAKLETIRKYFIPMDIISITPHEWRKSSSLIKDFAIGGKEFK